jgi:hypothetical protein
MVAYCGLVNVPSTLRNQVGTAWSYFDSDMTIVLGISVDVMNDAERNATRAEVYCDFMEWFKAWWDAGTLTTYGSLTPGTSFRFSSTDEPWLELTITLKI